MNERCATERETHTQTEIKETEKKERVEKIGAPDKVTINKHES